MVSNSSSAETAPERVRWWLVAIFVGAGIGTIFLARWLQGQRLIETEGAFWASVLTNIGSTLLLAALLVWFERRLVARVERSSVRTAEAAIRVAETNTRAAVESVEKRLRALEDLDRDYLSNKESISAEQEASLQRVTREVSFEAVRDAMVQTRDLGGIRGLRSWGETCAVTVPGGGGGGKSIPRITVTYVDEDLNNDASITFECLAPEGLALATWSPDDELASVLRQFRTALVLRGAASQAQSFRPGALMANIEKALKIATDKREGRNSEWPSQATLIELVSESVVLSDDGLEVRKLGLLKARDQFRRYLPDGTVAEIPDPTTPLEEAPDEWELALARAHSEFDAAQPSPGPWGDTPF